MELVSLVSFTIKTNDFKNKKKTSSAELHSTRASEGCVDIIKKTQPTE
jgi:hypothetical protein